MDSKPAAVVNVVVTERVLNLAFSRRYGIGIMVIRVMVATLRGTM